MNIFLCAALGALLWFFERNDTTERLGKLGLTSGFWSAVIIVFAALLLTTHHVELWRYGLALGLFVFTLTSPHNLLLSPPGKQVLGVPRDALQKAFYWALRLKSGYTLELGPYVIYSAVRYAIPVSGMGLILDSLALVIAGPLVSIGYYPWVHSEASKYVRAAVAGALIMGAMAA